VNSFKKTYIPHSTILSSYESVSHNIFIELGVALWRYGLTIRLTGNKKLIKKDIIIKFFFTI